MLNAPPRTSERIFPTAYESMLLCFTAVRKGVAKILENPRINAITFTTFRHWGATMTFHYTKNLLLVQKLLGHKNCKHNEIHTTGPLQRRRIPCSDSDTVEEAKELLATGFNYITEKTASCSSENPRCSTYRCKRRDLSGKAF